jgi:hypothetical protein
MRWRAQSKVLHAKQHSDLRLKLIKLSQIEPSISQADKDMNSSQEDFSTSLKGRD